MLDPLRQRIGFMNCELAGQDSTASTLVLFDQIQPQLACWQGLLQDSAAEPTAKAAIAYADDTRSALQSGRIDQAAPLLDQLDQLAAFLKEEIPDNGGGPQRPDAATQAGAVLTPLSMRLRAAFFALTEGNSTGAEAIIRQAQKPFADWAVLSRGTHWENPAATIVRRLAETQKAMNEADAKRSQAMVDALNDCLAELSAGRTQPSVIEKAVEKLNRRFEQIAKTPDAELLGIALVTSQPKNPPQTPEQAATQMPMLRDALDEVFQTMVTTGRPAPSLRALDLYRAAVAGWRKPLGTTAAEPLASAMADYLDDARDFLVQNQFLTAQQLVLALLHQFDAKAMAILVKRPAGDPSGAASVLPVLNARLAATAQGMTARADTSQKLIEQSRKKITAWAETQENTPFAEAANTFLGQVEDVENLWKAGKKREALKLCDAVAATGNRLEEREEIRERNIAPAALELAPLRTWCDIAGTFDWQQSPQAASELMDLAIIQFDQWKALYERTASGPLVRAIWLCANTINIQLQQGHPETARLLAQALGENIPRLEAALDASTRKTEDLPPQKDALWQKTIALRALALALDAPDRDVDGKTAKELLFSARHAPNPRTSPGLLDELLKEPFRLLAQALHKGDKAEAKTLLEVLTKQTRLLTEAQSAEPPEAAQPSELPKVYKIGVEDAPMGTIAATIARQYAVRLCFEELDLDSRKDALTAEALVHKLESFEQSGKLTQASRQRLEFARKILRENGPETLLDSGAPRFTVTLKADSLEELLEKLTTGTPYKWKNIGSAFVIFPRTGSVLDFPVVANVTGLTVLEAAERIAAQKPKGAPINPGLIFGGNWTEDPVSRLKARAPLLSFQCSALEALCLLTGATRPCFQWALAGYRPGRSMILSALPADKFAPPDKQLLPAPAAPATPPFVLDYEQSSMRELTVRIRELFAERLCFEQSAEECLSASDVVRRLNESARFMPLTEAQKRLRSAARRAGPGPFDASLRWTGRSAGTTFESFLDELTRNTPYAWRKTGGAYVVFPLHASISQTPVSLQKPAASLPEAIRSVLDAIQPPRKEKPEIEVFEKSVFREPLDFDAVTVAEAMCRIGGSTPERRQAPGEPSSGF